MGTMFLDYGDFNKFSKKLSDTFHMKPINKCNIKSVNIQDILDLLHALPKPAVITKNTQKGASKNYRKYPKKKNTYLDGYWKGEPKKAKAGAFYALHFKPLEGLLYIGSFDGCKVHDESGRVSLVVKDVDIYYIEDYKVDLKSKVVLDQILRKPGPVTYSYFYPGQVDKEESVSLTTNENELKDILYAWRKCRAEQAKFRQRVFKKHGAVCKVTGCAVQGILDAAHLPGRDWQKGHFSAEDGIPLRADLHRALDAGLIKLDAKHRLVFVDSELDMEYSKYIVGSE
ncbi:MAG: HNH endonuclease signature motif containing protein [Advenella sp.]|uniref:HNH endonuclease signature motif containing protein n=1 Tax=Advenella sp. TaxID=1872388 RepID=UPI002585F8E6|nr:HNH endonuclease signature motif containing protein [Advenella sp.]MDD3759056.1 HNH endonuclease signature motif containing protein [Advenella sp.]